MVDHLTRPGDAARAGRLGRGVLAMLLFAVPVALLAFAVRQQFDPLIHADESMIRAATDATRSAGTADLWVTVQEATQPFLLYCLATAVCIWAWAAKGLRNRAIWAF